MFCGVPIPDFILFSLYMHDWIQSIASEYTGVAMVGLILALLLGVYATAILLDQVRIMEWYGILSLHDILANDTNKG